jgi:hypothetical protein
MYIIKIFSDFCDSTTCKQNCISLLTASEYLKLTDNIIILENDEDNYTHAIILNCAMPILHKNIPKSNVVGLAYEPLPFLNLTPAFINYAQQYIGKYFIGDKQQLPEPFIEHQGFLWHLPRPPTEIVVKHKLMSIIISKKIFAPGHKYRHLFVSAILHNKFPIDIYGHGCSLYDKYRKNTNNFKGDFLGNEPYEDYLFSICIENFESNHYFSEKISSPIMYNCMPIYHGCKNIQSYFGDSFISLSGNIVDDMNKILQILQQPDRFYRKTYTPENIKTPNLLMNIPTLFSSVSSDSSVLSDSSVSSG